MSPIADWLEPNFLLGRAWRFETVDGTVHVPHLCFCAGGLLAGETDRFALRWSVQGQRLNLVDDVGCETVSFSSAQWGGDGRAMLFGNGRDGAAHVMREIDGWAKLACARALEIVGSGRTDGRPHLVIVRANENSIHSGWTDDLPEADRSWDLCVSWYGRTENFRLAERTEYAVLQNDSAKLPAIYELLHEGSPLWRYDYIAIVDDDMHLSRRSVNVLFETCREYKLELAQPSLHPNSFVTQFETRQQSAYILRYVNYVEPMMTVFSCAALRACISTFRLDEKYPGAMGYGIDYAWPKLVQGPPTSIAIVDKVAANHTRAHAKNYDLDTARLQGRIVSGLFGQHDYLQMRELGGVYAKPVRRNAAYEHDAVSPRYLEPEYAHLKEELAARDRLTSEWYEPQLALFEQEVARLMDLLARTDRLKSEWYEPELARLADEAARITALLADADRLKSGWYEPELTRLAEEVARVTKLLADADRLKSEWYEPELARLTDEVRRLTSRLAQVDRPEPDRAEPKPKCTENNSASL